MGEAPSSIILEFSKPFFLGIGGSGMSSLAHILLDAGFAVSGYDGKKSRVTEELKNKGAEIYSSLEEIPTDGIFDAAIYSSAIRLDSHPIASYFKKKEIPFYHRSQVLHSCFKNLKCIAVAGSHGKTTTTAMVAFILEDAGLSPSVMVGGDVAFLNGIGGRFGKGSFAVFESDESDGTFLTHQAGIRILTNIDEDHLDFYKTRIKLLENFAEFISGTPDKIITDLDDHGIRDCLELVKDKSRIIGFYEISEKDWNSTRMSFSEYSETVPYKISGRTLFFEWSGKEYKISSRFPGRHYLTNSLAAVIASLSVGLDVEEAARFVSNYSGVKRRLEFMGNRAGVDVYDDYGHHPTEVRAVLSSIKELSDNNGRSVILFQPHRFTRTQNLFREFAESLDSGDIVFLLPIYSAGEDPIPGVTSELIANCMKVKPILLSGDLISDLESLAKILKPGDKLVSLGAGNVRDWALRFLQKNDLR